MGKSSEIELILLASTKVGEKSLVLHCLSKEYGRRSFICSISKSSSMTFYLPLNILRCTLFENAKSELWRVASPQLVFPLNSLRSDIHKNTMSLFLSEVLYRSIREGGSDSELFEWCRKKILELEALQSDFSSFHLSFLLELCEVLGFKANLESLAPFAGTHYEDIKVLLSLDYTSFLLYPLSGRSRNEIAEILINYLGYHLESHLDIRSLKVLRELYS
ncbi:MAG: DNA repair protein RecO [Candidatus Cryptobacteroides sp.]